MKRGLRDVGASVRARLLERARREQSDFQLLLTRYVLERLLYRLSVSKYRERFILKGALTGGSIVFTYQRPTNPGVAGPRLNLLCSRARIAGSFIACRYTRFALAK